MSKIKLLLDVVQDVRALADSLQAVADFIQLGTASPEETPAQPVDSTPPKHTKPQITIDQVCTLLAEKSGEGKTQAVKALLYKYDAGKLSGSRRITPRSWRRQGSCNAGYTRKIFSLGGQPPHPLPAFPAAGRTV